jgi:PAS domain S-box-containing protein
MTIKAAVQATRKKKPDVVKPLGAIVESSDDAMIGRDLDGIVTIWNTGAERLYGYTRAEVIGRSDSMLAPVDRPDDISRFIEKLRRGEPVNHCETVRVAKDGRHIAVSLSMALIRDSKGAIVGTATVARDMTERKRAEEALRLNDKLATIGRLAAAITHEINNPLDALANLLFLIQTDPLLPNSLKPHVASAITEVGNVNKIVNNTLGFYRNGGKPVSVRLSDVLDSVVVLLRPRSDEADVHIETRYDVDGEIIGIPADLRQIFANLVKNAIEATKPGGSLVLHVRHSTNWRTAARGIRVGVLDSGCGIPHQARTHLFEPFFSTKEDKGTGLGLWVALDLLTKQGASVQLRSRTTPGRSSTCFSIFFPDQEREGTVGCSLARVAA